MLATVVAQDRRFALDHRRHAHGSFPNADQRAQRFLCVVGAKVDALVLVFQEQLAAVFEVAVLDIDERITRIGELEQELLFDLLELARVDLVALVSIRPREAEKLVLAAELGRQELVDEGDVAVKRAHLEDLSTPEPEPEVPMLLRLERITFLPLAP